MTKRERDALEFYADPENWKLERGSGQWAGSSRARNDSGQRARVALLLEDKDGNSTRELFNSTRELFQAPADESRVSGVEDLTGIAVRLRESISDGWSGDAAAASADIAEEAAAALIQCRDEITCLRDALAGLVRVFVNPYDGGEFEAGEVPELDAARATLFGQQPKP